MSAYDLQLFDARNGARIFQYPPLPQSYGSFAAGDDFFFNNHRYQIQKVGHMVAGSAAAPLCSTALLLAPATGPGLQPW